MSKTINDVRGHLFALLERLGDAGEKVDFDRAKMIVEASQAIINSAKVEVDYLKVVDGRGSAFIGDGQQTNGTPALPPGILGIRQHRLQG